MTFIYQKLTHKGEKIVYFKLFTKLGIGLFGFWLLVSCSDGTNKTEQKIVWDMPTPYADAVFHTQNIHQFVDDVKILTDGELVIRVHSGASLYKHPEIKRAVRSGQVPIGEILISLLGNENPIFQVDSLPLLATSYDEAKKLWQVSRDEIENLLEEQGLKLLFSVPWPPQGLYVEKQIGSLNDMEGLKIRVYNAMLSRLVELMGANPSTVQTPEIPQAFSTGLIDAMITSPSTGVNSQAWDFVTFYYDIQAWIPKNMVIVNKKAFDKLPKKIQKSLTRAAIQAEERGWILSEKETQEKTKVLAENGMQVLQPTDAFKTNLQAIREKMAAEWQQEAGRQGQEIIESFQNL